MFKNIRSTHRGIIDSHFQNEKQFMYYSRQTLYYWTKDGCIHPSLCILVYMALLVHALCEDFTDEVCKPRQRSNTNVLRCQDYEIIIKSQNSCLVYPVLDFLLPVPTTWMFNLGMDTSSPGLFQETHYHLFYRCRVWESSSLTRWCPGSSTSLDFSFNTDNSAPFSAVVL